MPEWVINLGAVLGGAVAVYAGIRADLAAIRVKAEMAVQRADGAHSRLDNLFTQRGQA